MFGFRYVEEPVKLSSLGVVADGVDSAFSRPFGDGAYRYTAVRGRLGGGDFGFDDLFWCDDGCIWQRFGGLSGDTRKPQPVTGLGLKWA